MSTTPAGPDATRPPVDFTQEVRFAVVMYGGSSLAIYINGVAQELLRLVRATAPEAGGGDAAHLSDEQLSGSERVYRRLGRVLTRTGVRPEGAAEGGPDATLRTRFVVDILTGTSAGGINAVYLAKALANDQDMDELQNLWVTEGDIGVLLNDPKSYEQLQFKLEDDAGEPWSVLNSRRIYLRLLEALRSMEQKRLREQGEATCPTGKSPLVEELDLYVTATDLPGRPLQLRLADDVVSEYRHRNVFQFRYRSRRASDIDHSDFGPEFNAFLAFAARATSAHQAAFSPVRLDDVTPIVEKYAAAGEHPATSEALRSFYQEYLLQRPGSEAPSDPAALAESFRRVWFVDGGTLDNKPFSFVVGQLPLRHADTFVDRKLLYVEPSPEHLRRTEELKDRPRIKENVLAALSSLPRYETIVEDLTRLLERNRLVERLANVMRGMERDLIHGMRPKESRNVKDLRLIFRDPAQTREWMLSKGPGWGSYQRLRVAEVTDDMTLLVARAAGFSEESDEFLAIRYLVRDWRGRNYLAFVEEGEKLDEDKKLEAEFLLDFDLPWAMRRVRFCIGKLNDLACLDAQAQKIADVAARPGEVRQLPTAEADRAEFRVALRRVREGLNKALVNLRGERRRLWSRDFDVNPFRQAIAALEISSPDLLELLREPTDEKRRKKAEEILQTPLEDPVRPLDMQTRDDAVAALTELVRAKLDAAIKKARGECRQVLWPPEGPDAENVPRWEIFLREVLWYYYKHFDDFDQITYPILYSTGVGEEADVIDVFRVSPEDARSLIDERADKVQVGGELKSVQKLAGTALGNFGAFFERKFRVNDIVWGRLDGAERVIAALLPEHEDLRRKMTEQAHRAILVEEKLSEGGAEAADDALRKLVWGALDAWDDPARRAALLNEAAARLQAGSSLRAHLELLAGGAEPRDLFRKDFIEGYEKSRRFTTDATIDSAKRANRVLGGMALGYFPAEGVESRKRKLAMWLGKRLLVFAEAAIEPTGTVRLRLRSRLIACYLLALLILSAVCLPAFVLWLTADGTARAWSFFLIFALTLPFALIPLLLAVGYNVAWLKLKDKLDALLPRAAGD